MHEKIEELIEKAKIIVDGKVMFRAEVVKEINDLGVKLHFTNKGVHYQFKA
jgi:hypothetical protein